MFNKKRKIITLKPWDIILENGDILKNVIYNLIRSKAYLNVKEGERDVLLALEKDSCSLTCYIVTETLEDRSAYDDEVVNRYKCTYLKIDIEFLKTGEHVVYSTNNLTNGIQYDIFDQYILGSSEIVGIYKDAVFKAADALLYKYALEVYNAISNYVAAYTENKNSKFNEFKKWYVDSDSAKLDLKKFENDSIIEEKQ